MFFYQLFTGNTVCLLSFDYAPLNYVSTITKTTRRFIDCVHIDCGAMVIIYAIIHNIKIFLNYEITTKTIRGIVMFIHVS